MAGTFVDRVQVLRDNVGHGRLTGSVEVNQRYAADQHWRDDYHHPDGGKAFYLRDPLYENYGGWLKEYAEDLLKDEGKAGPSALMRGMEKLSGKVFEEAPWEFGDLRGSGHPSVRKGAEIIHDRAPHIPRQSDEALKDKARLRELFDPDRYKRILG